MLYVEPVYGRLAGYVSSTRTGVLSYCMHKTRSNAAGIPAILKYIFEVMRILNTAVSVLTAVRNTLDPSSVRTYVRT